MSAGFYIIMAAQFFSALADNALLIAAIYALHQMASPLWFDPLLKLLFTLSYVLLAAFVGPFADSMAKGKVMLISNTIKIGGCLMIFLGVHPLIGYAIVGLGAATYSPAKYGILTELLPHRLLVMANGWVEGLTVLAIILGTVVGGALINENIAYSLLSFDFPVFETPVDSVITMALSIITGIYLLAAVFNLYIPETKVDHVPLSLRPVYLFREFNHCLKLLWRDKLGQISLSTTTLFWGAGGNLKFIVLAWAAAALGYRDRHALAAWHHHALVFA